MQRRAVTGARHRRSGSICVNRMLARVILHAGHDERPDDGQDDRTKEQAAYPIGNGPADDAGRE